MAIMWMVFGIGLKGREPTGRPRRSSPATSSRSTVERLREFPAGLEAAAAADSPELADARLRPTRCSAQGRAAAPVHGEDERSSSRPPSSHRCSNAPTDYIRDRRLPDRRRQLPVQARQAQVLLPALGALRRGPGAAGVEQPDFGGAPRSRRPTTRQPVTIGGHGPRPGQPAPPAVRHRAVVVADLRRHLHVLHRRDKEIWAKQAAEPRRRPRSWNPSRSRQRVSEYLPIFTMLVLAGLFAGLSFVASGLLAPQQADVAKSAPYECGIVPDARAGRALPGALLPGGDDLHHLRHRDHLPLPVGGHLPAARAVRPVEMVVFAIAVFVSFVYLISNGALDWGPARARTTADR